MNSAKSISRLAAVAILSALLVAAGGCKSKKLAQQAAQAKAQQEEALRKQKEEEMKKKEAEEKARKEEEERRAREAKNKTELSGSAKVEQYFSAISGAPSVASANNSINEVLSMFSSETVPVLIVISEEGGEKDYDKPTTIRAYLNYLKDQKKNINRVSNMVLDDAGKIKELELTKQK